MVDSTAELFWFRIKEWCRMMADKANDVVYTDDSKESLDVINLLLLGWILLGLVIYILGNVIATYLRKRKSSSPTQSTEDDVSATAAEHVSCAEPAFPERTEIAKCFGIPTCEGDDPEIVEWINNVFSWIYNQRVVSPVIDAWLSALNARTRLSSTEHGILVDFKDLLPFSGPPEIKEVRQSWSSRSDANVNCEMNFEDIAFEVVVTQFKEKDKVIIPFVLNVTRLSGVVNVDCSPEDLTFVAKYSEPPQVQSSSEAAKNAEIPAEECEPLCDLVCEITSEALSSAIVPLRFSCFPACPRLATRNGSEDDLFEAAESETEKKLLVKIIKATNLGGSKGCVSPYCVVEMDEPPQKFETHVGEGTQNPFWDSSFTFVVKDSTDLLFELYDKDKPSKESFLGLGIVGMDELIKNPSQRQIIPLQSRPLEDDDVTGSLTAEFLFLNQSSPVSDTTHLAGLKGEGASSGKTVETNSRVTSGGTLITTTTIKRTKEEPNGRTSEPPPLIPNPNRSATATAAAAADLRPMHAGKPRAVAAPVILANGGSERQRLLVLRKLQESADNRGLALGNGTRKSAIGVQEPPIQINVEGLTAENETQQTPIERKVEGLTVENETQQSPIERKVEGFTVQNETQQSPIERKVEGTTVENGTQQSTIDEKVEGTTIENDMQQTPIESKVEGTTLQNETQQSPIERKVEGTTLQSEMHQSPIDDKVEGTTIENERQQSPIEKESDGLAIANPVEPSDLPPPIVVPSLHVHVVPIPSIVVEAAVASSDIGSVINTDTSEQGTVSDPRCPDHRMESDSEKDAAADLPGTALKELEKHSSPIATSKSTLIIHSVQRPDSGASGSLDASPASHLSKDSHSESVPSTPSQDRSGSDRSRPKEKKSLMGSLRRRLSFHKNRSKSAENRYETGSDLSSRSASTDRIQKLSPFKARFLGEWDEAVMFYLTPR